MRSSDLTRSPRPRRLLVLAALAAAVLLVGVAARPPAAAAGGVGKWTDLSGATGTNLTQVGLVTTPDGLLHVAWACDSATSGKQDLMYRTVSAAGAFGAKRVIEAAWSTMGAPAMTYDTPSSVLSIVFSGFRSGASGEVYHGLTFTSSADGGASWTLRPAGVFDPPDSSAYVSPISAIIAGAQLYTSWYGSNGVWVLRGSGGGVAAYDYQSGLGSYGYYSNFGLDDTGDLWLVWASNSTDNPGLWAALVDQTTGAQSGTRVKLPSSTTSFAGRTDIDIMMSRVPVTGRSAGGGVYVAYPTGYPSAKSVRLWKLTAAGTTSLVVAGGAADKSQATIAAGADGRIWVAWSESFGGRERVGVRRSNAAVTKFGHTRYYTIPAGYVSVYHLAAAERSGKLDVFAHLGGTKAESTWHIQFKAPQ